MTRSLTLSALVPAHDWFPLHVAILGMLLCLPALGLGWHTDDHLMRAVLTGALDGTDHERSLRELFVFVRGAEEIQREADTGVLPWWTDDALRLAFFRPLSAATHWLDYQLWPEAPALMHLHSLLWFGAGIAAAASLFRRILPSTTIAGVAALAYAIDNSHGFPAFWLANRNAGVALFFCIMALLAHDRWRRDGWRIGAMLAPTALLLALLSAEAAVCTMAYIGAYALFLESGRWRDRVVSLLPSGVVFFTWWVIYKRLGFGASASGVYIDPATEPWIFARAAVERFPLLLAGLWSLVPSDLYAVSAPHVQVWLWRVACATVAALAIALFPMLWRVRTARFLCVGMLLSVLPACATFPNDRLLTFAAIGGMGLLALLLRGVWRGGEWVPGSAVWQWPVRALCVLLVLVHFVVAPLSLANTHANIAVFGNILIRAAQSLPTDPAVATQRVLIVNSPSTFISAYGPLLQRLDDRPQPARQLVLGSGVRTIELTRVDERTLVVRPNGGYLAPAGEDAPAVSLRHILPMFERMFRVRPMSVGDGRQLTGVSVEVTAVTDDGRPVEARFRFDNALESTDYRWLQWKDGVYEPFSLPRSGETVSFAPAGFGEGAGLF